MHKITYAYAVLYVYIYIQNVEGKHQINSHLGNICVGQVNK